MVVRLVALQLHLLWGSGWEIPRFAYVPVELALLACALLRERGRLDVFFVSRERIGRSLAWGLALGALLCGVEWAIEPAAGPLRWPAVVAYPLGLVNAILAAALYEELLFRSLALGYLCQWLRRPQVANIAQALLFAAAHLRYLEGPRWSNLASTLVGGLILGWITLGFKSVVPAVVSHAMINSYGMLFSPLGAAWHRVKRSWGL
jgi:membrane protease YdiL (CAAX protease family)